MSQTLCLKKNLIHDVRLIEKQVRSIEPGRGLLKFLNAISIDRKTDSIDRNCKKKRVFENQQNLKQPLLKALKNKKNA